MDALNFFFHAVCLLLPLLIQPAFTASENFQGWSCDELTPDLCELHITEGHIPIHPDGLWVKYWKYSSSIPDAGSGIVDDQGDSFGLPPAPAPLIMLHGGPGMTHNYMLPLKQLACRPDRYGRTRDVYFYDQGGCGESMQTVNGRSDSNINTTRLVEEHPYLLDPQYYATVELPQIVKYLGFDDENGIGYHIVANSWGTILAQYFVLNTPAKGLKSMTLSGPLSDGDLYANSQWSTAETNNLGQLPPFLQKRIHTLEAENAYESEEYDDINDFLTGHFTLRTQPAPDCFLAVFDGINRDIYVGLQGPSEFTFGGVLGGFNTTPGLSTINIPVALTSGEYDTMRPPVVDAIYREIPLSEWTIFNHSGHVSMIDDAGWMNDVVDDFLLRVEASASFEPLPHLCGPKDCLPKGSEEHPVKITSSGYSLSMVIFVAVSSFCAGAMAVYSWQNGRFSGYTTIY